MARRREVAKATPVVEPPGLLGRGPRAFVKFLPPQFDKGPMAFESITAARTLRAVARFAWFTATSFAGGQDWRHLPADCPRALRQAGEKLAADLLRQ